MVYRKLEIAYFLPLYPKRVDEVIYSVKMFVYKETTIFNCMVYWMMFILLIVVGIIKIVLTKLKVEKCHKIMTYISMLSSIFTSFIKRRTTFKK